MQGRDGYIAGWFHYTHIRSVEEDDGYVVGDCGGAVWLI